MDAPKRKPNRLNEYDYSTANAYFVTICTNHRMNLFWENADMSILCSDDMPLTRLGCIVNQTIREIPQHYPAISVDHYVIMPNHIHLLLQINSDYDGRPMVAPTLSRVIQQMKGKVTKLAGYPIWQKGFHDHIVRGEHDYLEIWNYIEGNPSQWNEDELCKELRPV